MAALTFAAIDVGSFEVEMGIYETATRSENWIRSATSLRWEKIPTITERSAMRWWRSFAMCLRILQGS